MGTGRYYTARARVGRVVIRAYKCAKFQQKIFSEKKWHPSSGILSKNFQFLNMKSDLFGKFSTFPFFTKIPKFYLSEPTSVQSFSEKKEPFSSFIIHHSSSSFIIMINSASVQCSTYLYD